MLLFVPKTGRKTWRFMYHSDGKERWIVFGAYPDMKLSEARARRDKARRRTTAHGCG
ncbi:Arm DNA-binding domain-containing protein [Qipengyuania spongiae]|uniref:Arm DNA-binding domain-containing protein n=1 Tax=Qipengyuania spongiae TaxID=2909673 RepID=UPI003B97C11F